MINADSLNEIEWDALSLVVSLSDGRKGENGYVYIGDSYRGWSTRGADLIYKMRELRQLIFDEGDRPCHQALIQIEKPELSLSIQFEYDDPSPWSLATKSLDISDYANSLRP